MIETETLFVETADSTNKMMREMIAQNPSLTDGFAIRTAYQSAGRGQGANRWESEVGKNLLVSFLFRPKCHPSRQFVFNQCFSLAVRKMLTSYVDDVKIKWPNDIYVGNKKIAGILIEHTIEADTIKHSIVGLGLNVNQTVFSESLPNPISLKLLLKKDFDLNAILDEIITQCNNYRCSGVVNECLINQEYNNNMYLIDTYALYEIEGTQLTARIVGTDKYGRLLLSDKDGKEYCCGMKEVKFLHTVYTD